MSDFPVDKLQDDSLNFNDAPQLIWVKVADAIRLLWKENPKLHDIGGVANSIARHGFQELPKFDVNLENVAGHKGAIKAGNGRIEALAWMEKGDDYTLPRGLAQLKDSDDWVMPLIIGTDAESLDLALAYAIDSNNLTMSGGNYTNLDLLKMWDQDGYLRILNQLGEANLLPVSVDGEDLDFLNFTTKFDPKDGIENLDVGGALAEEVMSISVVMPPDSFEEAVTQIREFIAEHPEWQAKIK